ncbi:PhzF family phenazine biosynthesis protein [Kineococcus gynurae]|uniref:PhzF family phenazine biosynthesis protein n=1 Tax=Kineococcus gynurae TaxID=452979 RepID=A0ABV5LR41_9ACTN
MPVPARPFAQVDVFSAEPYRGNPVAVVLEADGLDEETMQRIARWTNLSETTFVLAPTDPTADYRLRIWTPGGELPFAGHPTLGSAHAWVERGGLPRDPDRIVQECAAGLVEIARTPDGFAFAAPPVRRTGDLDPELLDRLTEALGLAPEQVLGHQWVDNGPGWCVLRVATAAEVRALRPDLGRIPEAMVGVVGAHPAGSPHAVELRAFCPGVGVAEDPVTGSLNASVAQWLHRTGVLAPPWTVTQGSALGRAGVVGISVDAAGTLRVAGATTTLFSGTARFPTA